MSGEYLLDTNIWIYLLTGKYAIDRRIDAVGEHKCHISEISVAELKFGAAKSEHPRRNHQLIEELLSRFSVVPIFSCLNYYASEKARLSKSGLIIDDFDLLIGTTAVCNGFLMVSNNGKHLGRIQHIKLENWALA